MSNTVLLIQVHDGTWTFTKSLAPWRRDDEACARAVADDWPVIALDIDYPMATLLGPNHGDRYFPHDEPLQRIVALGGRVWTALDRGVVRTGGPWEMCAVTHWSLPSPLDPQVVRDAFGLDDATVLASYKEALR